MLDFRDDGMGIRGTFGNPNGNSVFFLFLFLVFGVESLLQQCSILSLSKYIPRKMLDFKDEGMGIRRTFGNPSGNLVFLFFRDFLGRILITTGLNYVTFQIHSVQNVVF